MLTSPLLAYRTSGASTERKCSSGAGLPQWELLLELDEERTAGDQVALGDVDAAHDGLVGRGERRLHLHRLEHDEGLAGLDSVSFGDEHPDHRPGHRRGHRALHRHAAARVRGRIDIGRGLGRRSRTVEPPGADPGPARRPGWWLRERRMLDQERGRRLPRADEWV